MKVFKETQRFTQAWLHILMVTSFLIPLGILYKDYKTTTETQQAELITGLCILLSVFILSELLLLALKLNTKIDEKGIHYYFSPFQRNYKTIPWRDIEKAYIRTYNPISEYGGWGYRTSFFKKNNNAYNVKGDKGLQLEYNNGKKLLIGTQNTNTMQRVLEYYAYKLNKNE